MQKVESDPFVNIFATELCLLLDISSSAISSNILRQIEVANPITFLRDVSLMTRRGLGR